MGLAGLCILLVEDHGFQRRIVPEILAGVVAVVVIALLVDLLPKRGKKFCAVLEWLSNTALFGLLAWFGWRLALDDFEFEVSSPGLGLPQWGYTIWLPLLSALIVLRLVLLVASRRTNRP